MSPVYFDSFGIEYIFQEELNKIKDNSITHNIFRIENNKSIISRFYCIAFINFSLDYANLFSPNDYKNNGKIIYKYFKDKHVKRMNGKYINTCKHLNYVEHLLILLLTVTGCVSISTFASLVCVPVSITSSEVGIKLCAITTRIRKYKSIIKKKKKNHDQIMFVGKDKLNTIEAVIFKA